MKSKREKNAPRKTCMSYFNKYEKIELTQISFSKFRNFSILSFFDSIHSESDLFKSSGDETIFCKVYLQIYYDCPT